MVTEPVEDLAGAAAKRELEIAQRRFHKRNRELLADRVRAVKAGRAEVLELGSGQLDFTLAHLRPAARSVVATDLMRRFPEGVELPEGVTFQLEDALDLSFPDNSFDCVIALEVIEHVRDDVRFVAEGLRVTRPEGTFIWTTPNRLRLTALVRYLIGKPLRFPHTYAVDPVLGDITHERELSYGDHQRLFSKFTDSLISARAHGVWLGVPAWDLGILQVPSPIDRLAFNWHAVLVKR